MTKPAGATPRRGARRAVRNSQPCIPSGAGPAASSTAEGASPPLPGVENRAGEAETSEDSARSYTPIPTNWRPRFLACLGETSNVAAAARHAKVSLTHVYKHRRNDPAFRAAWFDALAEGYDNLEIELLQHLRAVQTEGEPPAGRKTFDAATAFRCLAAHRENVAREKGRRTLAQEAATIESINAKIDRLRLNQKAADKAIRAARKSNRARTARDAESADHGRV